MTPQVDHSQEFQFQTVNNFPLNQIFQPQISGTKVSISSLDYPVVSGYRHIRTTPSINNEIGYSSSQIRRIDNFIDRIMSSKNAVEQGEDLHTRISQAWLNEHNSNTVNALNNSHALEFGINSSKSAQILDFFV